MSQHPRTVAIIGGGIAGLCAAVYASKCGYQAVVLEQHSTAGGLATSWQRGGYTFETCLHWLLGSRPNNPLHAQWREVFDIAQLTFVNPEEYVRVESEHGDRLSIYTDVDRLEAELLQQAPQDATHVRELASAIRQLIKLRTPDDFWPPSVGTMLRNLPRLPLLRRLSSLTMEEYGARFTHPLLRGFFGSGDVSSMPVLALLLSMAWMSQRNAGYPVGGSKGIIRLILDNLASLGARVHLDTKVERILVEDGAAIGVELAGGDTVRADWVISAADGHATIYDLLGGRYVDEDINRTYRTLKPFPSYLQVSFGVARDLSAEGGFVTRLLDNPISVDPITQLDRVSFRIFHYDPTFAPAGKTAVTCFLPTRNVEFWVDLRHHDLGRYEAEKRRVAEAVTSIFERKLPQVGSAIELTDVSTPATVIRYTGNWKGSMEGWLMRPGSGFKPLRNTLPGLRQFMMAGHWVMPGGGLPSGLITARSAIRALCKHDHVRFVPERAARTHEAAA